MTTAAVRPPPARASTRGPVVLVFEVSIGLFFVAVFAWFLGIVIEVAGTYSLWKDEGIGHSRRIVEQDLGYIAAAPRSLLVEDTAALSQQIVRWVEAPYTRFGVLRWYASAHGTQGTSTGTQGEAEVARLSISKGMLKATGSASRMLSQIAVISMYVAQDVLLRLSVAAFALPAFVLACLMGTVDGLVRRDKRRWSGGRESSFVYHHAKRYTSWALTGGFGLYLTWPFGGFNPAYMVLVFCLLVASTLSTTVAAFKKYL